MKKPVIPAIVLGFVCTAHAVAAIDPYVYGADTNELEANPNVCSTYTSDGHVTIQIREVSPEGMQFQFVVAQYGLFNPSLWLLHDFRDLRLCSLEEVSRFKIRIADPRRNPRRGLVEPGPKF
jgi:hypothetical protein